MAKNGGCAAGFVRGAFFLPGAFFVSFFALLQRKKAGGGQKTMAK